MISSYKYQLNLTIEYKSLCINGFKNIINRLANGGAFIKWTAVKRIGKTIYKNKKFKSIKQTYL